MKTLRRIADSDVTTIVVLAVLWVFSLIEGNDAEAATFFVGLCVLVTLYDRRAA